jgi:flagellar biosynthesis/type III secretory pathway protein FliH
LAIAVAGKILQREIEMDPSLVAHVVKSALRHGHLGAEMVVRVNPMDRDTLKEVRSETIQHLEGVRSIRIESDDGLKRGDAMIECEMGELDLRLERQLQEVERAFERILESRTKEVHR